jgi:hypothetical protein
MLRIGTSRCSMAERAELQSQSRKESSGVIMNKPRRIYMRSNEVDKGMLGPQCALCMDSKFNVSYDGTS